MNRAMEIGGRIRKIRELLGLSQSKMAAATGVTISSWQRYERASLPKGDVLDKLVLLGASLDWIFTGEGSLWLKDRNQLTGELDSALLTDCIQASEEHLNERGERLDAKNKAMLVASLYSMQLNERRKKSDKQNVTIGRTDKSVA